MNDTSYINGFWIGDKLTDIGVLSIRSFQYHNHPYRFWSYDNVPNLPRGVEARDASEIVPKELYDKWFGPDSVRPTDKGRAKIHQAFADYFRYKLLHKHGGWWCDLDIVALKPFDHSEDWVFSWGKWPCVWMSEDLKNQLGIGRAINNGVIKAPAGSELMARFIALVEPEALAVQPPVWAGWLRPLSSLVCEFGLQRYVSKQPVFEPYGEDEWSVPFLNDVEPPPWAYSLHLYNSQGLTKEKPGSLVRKLRSKYCLVQ